MKRLLITRTRHDTTTEYLYYYSKEVIKEAEDKGWDVDEAKDEDNNAKNVQSRLEKTGPTLVIFNGHGNENCVCGNQNEILVETKNAFLLANKTVYARSCASLRKLGKEAVSQGCKAYVGYRGNFRFITTSELESTPLEDPAAKPTLEVSNEIALQLVNGKPVREAVEAAKKKTSEWMKLMLTSNELYAKQVFDSLFLNQLYLGYESKE